MTLFITLSNAWLWVIAGSIFLLAFLPYYFYLGYTFRTHSEALNSSVIKFWNKENARLKIKGLQIDPGTCGWYFIIININKIMYFG